MPYKPVKYVIFDMDGLLLNTEKIFYEAFEKFLARYGKKYNEEIRLKVMGTIPNDSYATFIKEYDLPLNLDEFYQELMKDLLPALQSTELLPGVDRLISHLKKHNIPIAVATSSGKDTFEEKIKKHKSFFDQFDHIVIGSTDPEVKNGKPAPDVFLVCASRFPENPSPPECLVFEDAPHGVQAAISAGMQVVMVPDTIVPENMRTQATSVIDSILDFKPEEFGLPKFD